MAYVFLGKEFVLIRKIDMTKTLYVGLDRVGSGKGRNDTGRNLSIYFDTMTLYFI